MVSCNYLPWLRNFSEIRSYSWRSTCLAYLYKSVYQVSHYDTKKMNSPLVMLHI
ncbi:hypothetical protein AHAS_Ahas09G0161400 [Arachis hypogaea]